MKRFLIFGLLIELCGCQLLPAPADAPIVPPVMNMAPPPAVEAADITPENAREKLRQLQEEIEMDQQGKN